LVLQMLLENCIKHNIVSADLPLKVMISVKDDMIHVENVLQRKETGNSTGQGLRNITERYRFFTDKEVVINENKNSFTVSIPMLTISP
jgi:LytS/YehU family sensor histidine kinase